MIKGVTGVIAKNNSSSRGSPIAAKQTARNDAVHHNLKLYSGVSAQ